MAKKVKLAAPFEAMAMFMNIYNAIMDELGGNVAHVITGGGIDFRTDLDEHVVVRLLDNGYFFAEGGKEKNGEEGRGLVGNDPGVLVTMLLSIIEDASQIGLKGKFFVSKVNRPKVAKPKQRMQGATSRK